MGFYPYTFHRRIGCPHLVPSLSVPIRFSILPVSVKGEIINIKTEREPGEQLGVGMSLLQMCLLAPETSKNRLFPELLRVEQVAGEESKK